MNARKNLLLMAAIVAGLVPVGCDSNEANLPNQVTVPPILPEVVPIVTVTTSRGRLTVGEDHFAQIRVTATDPDTGASVPNLTIASMSTNLGHFQSLDGPAEVNLEFFFGVVGVPLFPGESPGEARVRAEVLGGVGLVRVSMRCPSEGCGGAEVPPILPYY
ncbi:MAG: hypothetical protein AMXMBFR36_15910 [Acidobacteriota bacterium]